MNMDSKSIPIISQSNDDCINQHHQVECSHFNIIKVNTISHDNQIDHETSINSKYTSLNGKEQQPVHHRKSKIPKINSKSKIEFENENSSEIENENKTEDEEEEEPTTACNELKIMIKLAIPVSITSIARVVMWNTDQIFLGHLGTSQLAGACLADTCMEILTMFVYTPAWSLNSLCSQALGSGNPIMVGYWLQLTIIICSIICIPVSIGYFYVSDLINAVSDDAQVVEYSKEFAHYAVLFLWTNAMLAAIRLYHQSLEIVRPFTIISVIAILLNIAGNQLWLYGLDINIGGWNIKFNGLGFIGSPLATSTSMCIQLIMYYLWCFKIKKYHLKHETWNGWSLKKTIFSKKRVKEYGKVIVPMIISNASENWGYQVVILYAATLDAAQIAAMSCTFAVWGILWSFYSGFGSAIVTRFGKKIGSGNIEEAKLVAKMGVLLSLSTCILTASCIYILANELAMVYSKDPEVILLMKQTIRLLCGLYTIGGIGWCAMNILEAMSKNKVKGIINVATAWLGYVPACVWFMTGDNHKLLHVSAVSCIFLVGIVVEVIRSIALWIIVFSTDWKKACIEAQERNDAYDNMAKDENKKEDINNNNKLEYISLDKLEMNEDEVDNNKNKNDSVSDVHDALKCGLLDSSQAEAATAV